MKLPWIRLPVRAGHEDARIERADDIAGPSGGPADRDAGPPLQVDSRSVRMDRVAFPAALTPILLPWTKPPVLLPAGILEVECRASAACDHVARVRGVPPTVLAEPHDADIG